VYIFVWNIAIIENGQICPSFHKFIAERDKSTNCDDDIDMNILNNIQTHFNQETYPEFCANISDETDDSMDVDSNVPSSKILVPTEPGSSNENNNQFGRQENLGGLYYCYIC